MSRKETDFGEPIDQLLRAYEVTMQMLSFLIELHTKAGSKEYISPLWQRVTNGPVKHWKHIRESLLKIHVDGFDLEKYVGPSMIETVGNKKETQFLRSRVIAAEVASWTKSSRRVYRVPKDLQVLLAATSLKSVDWSMIRWPFDSFLISLEEPLVFRGKITTAILIAKIEEGGEEAWCIHAITTDLPTMESVFINDQLSRIEQSLKRNDSDSLKYAGEKIASAIKNRLHGGGPFFMVNKDCFEPNGAAALFEKEDLFGDGNDVEGRTIFRIVFGLLLYLQSRPATEVISNDWHTTVFERKEGANRLIRIPSEVCSVKSIFTLTHAEREILTPILRGVSCELSAHYREGHWRRPPGKGGDPTYPKSVWVCPTIVRKDKLSEGGLPVGSTEVAS